MSQPNTNDSGKLKAILYILLVLLVVGGVIYWAMSKQGEKWFANEFNGKITAVNGDVITVEGYLNPPNTNPRKNRIVTIDFTILPETKIIKNSIMIEANRPDGEAYTPEEVKSEGSVSDLKYNVAVSLIKSDKNLVGVTKADATEIEYSILVLP